ncbi:hypothetical protein [Streptomyces sp.]|uniref:hypothetical protein n=1 Tax=Streptomyces sp. TaxID=1931 RepID=UPI002810CAD6|nr:hypothetical protein [Streptomyces sp.]
MNTTPPPEPTAPTDRAALRDRIADILAAADGWRWVDDRDRKRSSTYRSYQDRAGAVMAVLPAPADRAAVLREEADRIDATRADFPIAVQNGITWATSELRRTAAAGAQPATPDTETPRRGDQVEAWLKAQRDASTAWPDWHTLDSVLDRYRLHADTRTPLGEHVCEGKVVGDCECLEQPAGSAAAPAQDTPTVPCAAATLRGPHPAHDWEPQPGMTPVHCPGTAPAKDTRRSFGARLLDAVTHSGPGYDLIPTAEQPTTPAKDTPPAEETFCDFGVTDAQGSGCVLLAGHEPANRHIVTPGDTDEDDL